MKYPSMKQVTTLSCNRIFIPLLCVLLLSSCSSKKNNEEQKASISSNTAVDYEVSEDKASLASYYNLDHIKEWYPKRILPPVFNFNIDLCHKSVIELALLRNEIFARNGYLFDDAVLRGYFNQYKWYQPIFEVDDFKVQLNKQEQDFVNKVIKRENELAKDRYVKKGDYEMIDLSFVHNMIQFKDVSNDLKKALAEKNFAIVPAKHEQFFHVYDENSYQYIPNFITTDLYLQVLHKHFSTMLQKIEENKFVPILTTMLKNAYEQSVQFEKGTNDANLKSSSQWSTAYLAIAYSLVTGKSYSVSNEMQSFYKDELEKISSAEGVGSEFLDSKQIQYSQFEPRGNYTKNDTLKSYFRCIKWLNTAPIYIDQNKGLVSAILIASFIKKSPENTQAFTTFNTAIQFIVGEEDNLSLSNLIATIPDINVEDIINNSKLAEIRKNVLNLQSDRIKPKGGTKEASDMLTRPALLFTAGRYTFDAEILSRLIHVLQPKPLRPFPKGLDIFAVFDNKEAENILLNEYNEARQWKTYPDSIWKLKKQFSTNKDFDKTIYSKTFDMIRAINDQNPNRPLFMKTSSWDRKNLITSLSAWTELKHDMMLYAEQPYAAEAGEGGGPPPPQHVSYVEPNVAFWKKALQLIYLEEKTLGEMDLLPENVEYINKELIEIGQMLLVVSEKELARENLTKKEFDDLSWLGGRIEYLTFRICDSDHLPEKDRLIALSADVYNYNGTYLEEAVGLVDDIYVIAEINGKAYLTKGAVFSYYEFTSDTPLTDEAWQSQLISGKEPKRPAWTNDITIKTNSLESKPEYSF